MCKIYGLNNLYIVVYHIYLVHIFFRNWIYAHVTTVTIVVLLYWFFCREALILEKTWKREEWKERGVVLFLVDKVGIFTSHGYGFAGKGFFFCMILQQKPVHWWGLCASIEGRLRRTLRVVSSYQLIRFQFYRMSVFGSMELYLGCWRWRI